MRTPSAQGTCSGRPNTLHPAEESQLPLAALRLLWCYDLHWSDDAFFAKGGEFALLKVWKFDIVLRTLDWTGRRCCPGKWRWLFGSGIALPPRRICGGVATFVELGDTREGEFHIVLPRDIGFVPLLFRQKKDFGGGAIILANARQMDFILGLGDFPVSAQLLTSHESGVSRDIWLWVNGEIGVAKLISPFVIWVGDHHGGDLR